VTGTLAIDTILFFVVVRLLWRRPLWMVLAGAAAFLTVDLAFLAANATKILHGGWFPVGIALVVFALMTTWQRGRAIITERRTREEGRLPEFLAAIRDADPPSSGPGHRGVPQPHGGDGAGCAARERRAQSRPPRERGDPVDRDLNVPRAGHGQHLVVDDLSYADDGIIHLKRSTGSPEEPDVPRILGLADERKLECAIDVEEATFFVSRAMIVRRKAPGMRSWRKGVFIAMARNAASPATHFGLPGERTVTVGTRSCSERDRAARPSVATWLSCRTRARGGRAFAATGRADPRDGRPQRGGYG
jgi:KUP system potassium uptake protein